MLDDDRDLATFEAARLRIARLRVGGDGSLKEVVARACEAAALALNVDRVGVWLFSHDGKALQIYHQHDRRTGADFAGTLLHRSDFPSYFGELSARRLVRIDDVTRDPVAGELAAAYFIPAGIGASLDAPILLGGEAVGVVCHEHSGGPRTFTRAECELAMSHADRLAEKIAVAAQHAAERRVDDLAGELEGARSRALTRQLAAGLGLDLADIFQVVRGNAELIARDGETQTHPMARDIMDAAQRGAELAADLTALGHGSARPRLLLVREHLADFLPALKQGLSPSELALTGDSLGRVLVDPTQLERIVMNLVVNARDAMPAGGEIRVDVGDVDVGDAADLLPGCYVLLEVRDQGAGMDEATAARIFEPYFTTKPTGTGLGLAIVLDLVQRAGGFVHVRSSPGAGTAMRIYLPRLA